MAYEIDCSVNRKNIGLSELCQDLGLPIGYIITPSTFEIADQATALLYATWQNAIHDAKRDRIYPSPTVVNIENASEETVYEDFPVGDTFVRDGKIRFRVSHQSNSYLHRMMRTQSRTAGRVFFVYQNGRISGASTDDIKFKGFEFNVFQVEGLSLNDGTASSKTTVYIALSSKGLREYQDNIVTIDPSNAATPWEPGDLKSLINATVEVFGTPTSSELVLDVKEQASGQGIMGLVQADFLILDGGGSVQTPSGFSESTTVEGRYTLTYGASLVTGTANLDTPANMTTKGYESVSSVAFTI